MFDDIVPDRLLSPDGESIRQRSRKSSSTSDFSIRHPSLPPSGEGQRTLVAGVRALSRHHGLYKYWL
jgi:hypothetical protein